MVVGRGLQTLPRCRLRSSRFACFLKTRMKLPGPSGIVSASGENSLIFGNVAGIEADARKPVPPQAEPVPDSQGLRVLKTQATR